MLNLGFIFLQVNGVLFVINPHRLVLPTFKEIVHHLRAKAPVHQNTQIVVVTRTRGHCHG